MANKALDDFNTTQSMPLLFEVVNGNGVGIYQFVLPINPENYEMTSSTRTNLTYTQGDAYEDNIGMTRPKISMSGTFTYSGRTDHGPADTVREGNTDAVTGWDIYQEFAGMIFQFYELFGTVDIQGNNTQTKQNPLADGRSYDFNLAAYEYFGAGLNLEATSENKPSLNFYNFSDNQFYQVQINRFVIKRSIQRRMLYQYDLQMTVLSGIKDGFQNGAGVLMQSWHAGYRFTPPNIGMLGTALAVYGAVSTGISGVLNLVDTINNTLGTIRSAVGGFVGGITTVLSGSTYTQGIALATAQSLTDLGAKLPNLYTAQGAGQIPVDYHVVEDTAASLQQAVSIAITIDGIPHEFIDMLRRAQREVFVYQANKRLFAQTSNTITAGSTTVDATKLEILTGTPLDTQLAQSSLTLSVPETTLFGASPTSSQNSVVREVVIRATDSIQSIARDSKQNWMDIAALNSLDYPYISATSVPGANTLAPGQKIKLPGVPIDSLFAGDDTEDINLLLFGTDEYLDDDGLQSFDANGDIATIGGIPNLIMQLTHRQGTKRGDLSLLGHPEYGTLVPTYLGKPGLDIWYRRAMLEQQRVMLQDPRVVNVENVKMTVDGTGGITTSDVTLINKTSLSNLALPLLV